MAAFDYKNMVLGFGITTTTTSSTDTTTTGFGSTLLSQMERLHKEYLAQMQQTMYKSGMFYPSNPSITLSFDDVRHLASMRTEDLRNLWASRFGDAEVAQSAIEDESFFVAVFLLLASRKSIEVLNSYIDDTGYSSRIAATRYRLAR